MLDSLHQTINYQPLTAPPETSVEDAIAQMSQNRASCILVVETVGSSGLRPIGLLTERDVVRLIATRTDLSRETLQTVMTRQLITMQETEIHDVFEILELLHQHQIQHLPILNDRQQLVGLVTPHSLLNAALEQQVAERTTQLEAANQALKNEIQERQLLEEKLRSSEAQIRSFFEAMTEVVLLLDAAASQIEVAPTNPDRFYDDDTNIIHCTIEQFTEGKQSRIFLERIQQALQTQQIVTFEYSLPICDREIYFAASISPISDTSVAWVARDITDRKQIEKALHALTVELEKRVEERTARLSQAKEQLQAVLDAVPGFVSWISADGRYLGVNQHLAKAFNLAPDAFIGQELGFLDKASPFTEAIRSFLAISALSLSWVVELYIQDSQEYYAIAAQKYNQGQAVVLVGINITERKQAEEGLRQLNQALELKVEERIAEIKQANRELRLEIVERQRAEEKLKAFAAKLAGSNRELQDFAYVASHDLQEPLRKIQIFGERLQAKCGNALSEQGRDYLSRMQNATRRMQQLIVDLLALSRVTTKAQPFVPVDLAIIVQDVLTDLEMRIEEANGHIEVGPLTTIQADPLQMRQLLQNLIGNALKFHAKDVSPIVKVNIQLLSESIPDRQEGHQEAALCQLIVEDNGIGFDCEQYLSRIFNAFQRLHGRSSYEGTGIGLTICRKIVDRHHGSITARSLPGQGSTFIVTLPVEQPAPNTEATGDGNHGK